MNEIHADHMVDSTLRQVRIARISTVSFFVATQLKSQIFEIARVSEQVSVVCSDGPELQGFAQAANIICCPIQIERGMSPLKDLISLFKLYLLFRQSRTNIAHSTTPKAGLITAIAAFLARVPVRLHTFTGQPWVSMTGVKRSLLIASEGLICQLNTRCYADSASQRDFLLANGVGQQGQIAVLGYGSLAGVDVSRFASERFSQDDKRRRRLELGVPEGVPVVMFLGRIARDKGVRVLLQAFRELKASGSAAHLVFVGPFDTDSGVEGAITSTDVGDVVDTHVAGYTESPEAYLSIADILCLPSYREGFGTSVIEAASMGIPTVGTSIYGLVDAIANGDTGVLVEPGRVNQLRDALNLLLSDQLLRTRMGQRARVRANELFNSNYVNSKLINEYGLLWEAYAKKNR